MKQPVDFGSRSVVVLFSGGLDSTVALWWVTHHRGVPHPLSIDYRTRPHGEKRAALEILAQGSFPPLIEVELPFYHDLETLRKGAWPLPGLDRAPAVYLPAKNLIFYGIAAYYAEILGADSIVGGHYRSDTRRFPDARGTFFRRLNRVLEVALWPPNRVRLVIPFLDLSKSDIVRIGLELGAPVNRVWSCYHDGPAPCGTCRGCRDLREALQKV